MDVTDDPIEALRRLRVAAANGALEALAGAHGLTLVVVFGSGLTASKPNDLDIAVDHDGRLDVLSLLEDLYQLLRFERVDLLDLRRAGVVASAQALGYGEPIYETRLGRFAERQVVALAQFWDTQWLRDQQLEVLAG